MAIDEEDVCLQLFLDWLNETADHPFRQDQRPFGHLTARFSDGQRSMAVAVRPLLNASQQDVWQAYRMRLEGEISVGLPGAFALWLPPGADLPASKAEAQELRQRARQAALALQPGQRGQLSLPIKLHLRKSSHEGRLMSVVGGLDPFWAQMSSRVRGSFDLDSTALHRLPQSEEERQRLIDGVCVATVGIHRLGHWQALDATDVWTIQRLCHGQGFAILGVPPELTREPGSSVRRNLRRILADARLKLAAAATDLTALLLLGIYQYADQENVSTALRGFDPSLYAAIDFICLAADGYLKPIIEPRAGQPPAGGAPAG